MHTNQSEIHVAIAARTHVVGAEPAGSLDYRVVRGERSIAHECTVAVERAASVAVEKVVTLFTSRDRAISEPQLEAVTWLDRLPEFEELSTATSGSGPPCGTRHPWCSRAAPPKTELAIRLHLFHVLQVVSANTHDLDVGLPARGLHGDAYRGHVFWDELLSSPTSTCTSRN